MELKGGWERLLTKRVYAAGNNSITFDKLLEERLPYRVVRQRE
jgi:hypothetical protein